MNRQEFFDTQAKLGLALTFDDVVLQTGHSETLPSEVSLTTQFSRKIELKIPLVSAAMDTVTEHQMAIAMAMAGGIGVIHRNMGVEHQVSEVERVKYRLNGLIRKPICVHPNDTVAQINARRQEKGWSFESFPVVDSKDRLLGVITGNDFKFCVDTSLQAKDVMTPDPLTGSITIGMKEAFVLLQSKKRGVLPLVDNQDRVQGMYLYSDLKRIVDTSLSVCNVDEQNRLRVAAAIGVGDGHVNRAEALVGVGVDALVIDTAHANTSDMKSMLQAMSTRPWVQDVDIVVGNFSQSAAVWRILESRDGRIVSGIKVGQGPGSICTTRVVSGAGRPQLTAIFECVKEASSHDIPVIADGGIRHSGDITKAIAAGASCVMLGSVLAGTEEAPGETMYHDGKMVKVYRGMGSLGAMSSHPGGGERYRQVSSQKFVPEGVESYVPFRGPIGEVIYQHLGGLRSGMGYVGASDIPRLQQHVCFERVTPSGDRESHPHDVAVIRDAPNYAT